MSTGEVSAELQQELAARWDEIGFEGTGERCLVVLPSMTIDIPRPLLARAAPTLQPQPRTVPRFACAWRKPPEMSGGPGLATAAANAAFR